MRNIFSGFRSRWDHSAAVRRRQRIANLADDVHDFANRLSAGLREVIGPVATLQELEHHVDRAVVGLTHIGHFDDVFVADARRGFGFIQKARHRSGVIGEGRMEKLDRDPSSDQDVFGFIDGTHAAFAQLPDDAVAILKRRTDAFIRHEGIVSRRA